MQLHFDETTILGFLNVRRPLKRLYEGEILCWYLDIHESQGLKYLLKAGVNRLNIGKPANRKASNIWYTWGKEPKYVVKKWWEKTSSGTL